MSTGCEFYGDALVDLAAGRLDPGRAERVRAHLADCSACQEALDVIRAVRGAPAPMPDELETRLQAAVLGDTSASAAADLPGAPLEPGDVTRVGSGAWYGAGRMRREGARRWTDWRPGALPLAAAAAVVLWVGANQLLVPAGAVEEGGVAEAPAEYDPYGAWPGADGEVAGELVLSELSVEELEALLEEMQS